MKKGLLFLIPVLYLYSSSIIAVTYNSEPKIFIQELVDDAVKTLSDTSLTKEEKDVFKTAFELDQKWIIELSADRTPHISQAQSINIFLPADVHKKELHQIHFQAWKKGLKSLYYCRSKSIQRAENVNDAKSTDITANVYKSNKQQDDQPEYEECLSCQ